MAQSGIPGSLLRVADMNDRAEKDFALVPAAPVLEALAQEMDLIALRKLRFAGVLRPEGSRAWRLEAQLGATVVQPCVVTLEPVTTRIEEEVTRLYTPDYAAIEARAQDAADKDGVPMPEDDTVEPLPAVIDLAAVMAEALALALPQYPRADGVSLGEAVYAAKGVAPLRDDDVKPFAGLAGLRDKLGGTPSGDDTE